MRTIHRRHLQSVHVEDDRHAVIETPDREILEVEGCSHDELEAKLHDFEAWAS